MQNLDGNKVSFNKVCDDWLSYKKPKVKESSDANYDFKINKYLKNKFGEKQLEYFLNYDINRYIQDLQGYLANKTINDIIIVLKSILKYAGRKYNMDFKLDLVSAPSITQKEVKVFDEKERRKIENYILKSNELKYIGILISLFTGMRIGEVCALKWKDIDFETKLINVSHTVQRIYLGKKNTKVIVTTPKTKKSIRKIPLSKTLFEKLKPISKEYTPNDFILTGDENKLVEPLGYRYTYKKLLENCNVEYKKYHCLRHTFATRCVAVGMDIKSLSEVLGHSNVSVTLGIYVHSSYDVKKKFIDKL